MLQNSDHPQNQGAHALKYIFYLFIFVICKISRNRSISLNEQPMLIIMTSVKSVRSLKLQKYIFNVCSLWVWIMCISA